MFRWAKRFFVGSITLSLSLSPVSAQALHSTFTPHSQVSVAARYADQALVAPVVAAVFSWAFQVPLSAALQVSAAAQTVSPDPIAQAFQFSPAAMIISWVLGGIIATVLWLFVFTPSLLDGPRSTAKNASYILITTALATALGTGIWGTYFAQPPPAKKTAPEVVVLPSRNLTVSNNLSFEAPNPSRLTLDLDDAEPAREIVKPTPEPQRTPAKPEGWVADFTIDPENLSAFEITVSRTGRGDIPHVIFQWADGSRPTNIARQGNTYRIPASQLKARVLRVIRADGNSAKVPVSGHGIEKSQGTRWENLGMPVFNIFGIFFGLPLLMTLFDAPAAPKTSKRRTWRWVLLAFLLSSAAGLGLEYHDRGRLINKLIKQWLAAKISLPTPLTPSAPETPLPLPLTRLDSQIQVQDVSPAYPLPGQFRSDVLFMREGDFPMDVLTPDADFIALEISPEQDTPGIQGIQVDFENLNRGVSVQWLRFGRNDWRIKLVTPDNPLNAFLDRALIQEIGPLGSDGVVRLLIPRENFKLFQPLYVRAETGKDSLTLPGGILNFEIIPTRAYFRAYQLMSPSQNVQQQERAPKNSPILRTAA